MLQNHFVDNLLDCRINLNAVIVHQYARLAGFWILSHLFHLDATVHRYRRNYIFLVHIGCRLAAYWLIILGPLVPILLWRKTLPERTNIAHAQMTLFRCGLTTLAHPLATRAALCAGIQILQAVAT